MYAGPFVSVTDFDVVGDGVTPDTRALNRAFASVGRFVYVPRGVYLVDQNLDPPQCAGIVGDGDSSAVLLAGASVTRVLPLGGACNVLKSIQIAGGTSRDAAGVVFGAADSGAYLVENVRVTGFTGANGVGIHCRNALKSVFIKATVERNTTNLLIDGTDGFPTTLSFTMLVCNNALGVGCRIATADSVIFNEPAFDSNAAEGILIRPRRGGTITDVVINNARFEDNHSRTPGFQFVVDGTAGGQCTARVKVRGGYWHHTPGNARSILLTGAGTAGYLLDSVQVPDEAGTILISDGAYGVVSNWAASVSRTKALVDLSVSRPA